MFYCEICGDWMDCWNDCENCDIWEEEYGQHLETYNNIVSVEELTEACDTLLEE